MSLARPQTHWQTVKKEKKNRTGVNCTNHDGRLPLLPTFNLLKLSTSTSFCICYVCYWNARLLFKRLLLFFLNLVAISLCLRRCYWMPWSCLPSQRQTTACFQPPLSLRKIKKRMFCSRSHDFSQNMWKMPWLMDWKFAVKCKIYYWCHVTFHTDRYFET